MSRRDGPQPGPGDVGDGEQPGGAGVGALAGRLGGVDAEAAPGAAVLLVGEGDRVARRAAAGEEVEDHHVVRHGREDPPHQPGRLGRLEDVPDDLLELGDRGVGGADLLGQPDRAQLLAPAARASRCSQSFWNTSTRSPLLPLIRRQTRSSRPLVDQRPAPSPHRRRPSPKTGAISWPPSNGPVAHQAALRVAVQREVQGPRRHRVELLVGVAQRQVPVPTAVRVDQREVAARRRCRRCWRRARSCRRPSRRPAGTRGSSRTRCPAAGPWG